MRILLDTHVLLWSLGAARKLPPAVRAEISNPTNEVLFSSVSIWEIAIKAALRKKDFNVSPREMFANAVGVGFSELPLRSAAALLVENMASHHGDPFDRVLVAQAVVENANFLTADPKLTAYSDLVRLI